MGRVDICNVLVLLGKPTGAPEDDIDIAFAGNERCRLVDSEKGALTAQYALGKQVAPPMSYEVSLPGTMKAMMSSLAELAERQAAAEGVIVTSYVVRRSISCEDPDFEQIELDIYADETAERALVFWDRLGGSIDRWKVDLKPADRELLDAKVSVQVLWR